MKKGLVFFSLLFIFVHPAYSAWEKEPIQLPDLTRTHTTENFIIHYDVRQTTSEMAKAVGESLEIAWKVIFSKMGYPVPETMKTNYVHITIKDLGDAARGFAYDWGPSISLNLWDRFANAYDLQGVCGHEFFHLVQFSYAVKGRQWLREATAAWIEGEIYNPKGAQQMLYGFVKYRSDWDRSPEYPLTWYGDDKEYGASIFFQYLTERRPGGSEVIKRMWEYLGEGYLRRQEEALAVALGDAGAWGRKTQTRLAEFSVANLIRDPTYHGTYSFERLRGLGSLFGIDLRFINKLTYPGHEKNRLKFVTRTLKNPLTFDYLELTGRRIRRRGSADLVLAVQPVEDTDWAFHLVTVPRESGKKWKVKELSLEPGKWTLVRLKDFPGYDRVYIAAARLSPTNGGSYRVAAAYLEPPIVESLEIKMYDPNFSSMETVWAVKRKPIGHLGRFRTAVTVDRGIDYRPGEIVEIFLKMSRPMGKMPKLTIGDVSVPLQWKVAEDFWASPQKDMWNYGQEFRGMVSVEEWAKWLQKGEEVAQLPVVIEGEDTLGATLDADPSTQPSLQPYHLTFEDWEGGGSPGGGPDRLQGKTVPLYSMGEPPYLVSAQVIQYLKTTFGELSPEKVFKKKLKPEKSKPVIYEARWIASSARQGRRRLKILVSREYNPEAAATLILQFNRPVFHTKVTLAGVPLTVKYDEERRSEWCYERFLEQGGERDMEQIKKEVGAIYSGKIPVNGQLAKALKQKRELVLSVDAISSGDELPLDPDPRTQASFDWKENRWKYLEGSQYGFGESERADTWHKLGAGGRSVVLLLDASGSMEEGGRLKTAKAGIGKALKRLDEGDEAALIVFSDCDNIQTVVPFTNKFNKILRKLKGIQASGGTPLGDTLDFANEYLKKNARYPQQKVLLFSDGESTCGSDPLAKRQATAHKPKSTPEKKAPKKTEQEREVSSSQWRAYRIEQKGPKRIDIVELYYKENIGKTSEATLLVRRYPVSILSTAGRIIWSISWSAGKTTFAEKVDTKEAVFVLRKRAEQERQDTIKREELGEKIQKLFGPGSEPLRRI